MPNRNSIEYNLTNKLFTNCRRRFIIDLNDNDDVQITSCIESDEDRNCLVNFNDGQHSPKELKYQVGKGRKNKFQFRTYSLDKNEEQLRDTITSLFDDEDMNTQFERRTNFINHPGRLDQLNLNSERLTRSGRRLQEEQDETARSTVKRGRPAKEQETTVAEKSPKKAPAKAKATNKRARSDDQADEQTNRKRRKVAHNQDSAGNKRTRTRSGSRSRNNSRSRNSSKARKSKPKAKTNRPKAKKTNKKSTADKSIELIELESTVESEDVVECSPNKQNMSDEMIRTAVNQIADYILANENRQPEAQQMNATSVQESETQTVSRFASQLDSAEQATQSGTPVEIITSDRRDVDLRRRKTLQTDDNDLITPIRQTIDQDRVQTSSLKKKYDYSELEKRIAKMKERNESNEERLKKFKLGNKANQQMKAKQAELIYHLNDNLISIDNKLGQKHLITCLTVILIGELVHYLQPQSSLNYDQLPVGCLLISNLINSVQLTILGHFIYKFTSLVAPCLFSFFKTSSRLICYCILLLLSYGMLRKSVTNWIVNNQSSIKLFPLNVALSSSMLMLYSFTALCLSTDGNRLIRKRTANKNEDSADQMLDEKLTNSKNWLNSIVNLLTPYIIISPIVGSNSCRLYAVPKPVLVLSSLIYLVGLYKYVACRRERTNLNQRNKLLVYELKSNFYLISNASSRIRYLTFFGALLIITAYNLLVLNLWSLVLELLTLVYLKLKSKNLDHLFTKMNKSIYTKYKNNNPYVFIPYIH